MNKCVYRFTLIILTFICITNTGCREEPAKLDAEVYINEFYKTKWYGSSINVKYQILNISERPVNGWNVFFRISMKSGNQIEAFSGLTYHLEPDSISKELMAFGRIPDHFKTQDIPISAAVKFIDVY